MHENIQKQNSCCKILTADKLEDILKHTNDGHYHISVLNKIYCKQNRDNIRNTLL